MLSTRFILSLMNAFTLGALLFLVASGFTLIFGLMRVLNLAHGAFYLWGGYIGLVAIGLTGNFWLGLLAGGLGVTLGGGLAERFLFRRVRGDTLAEVLLTVGLGLILADMALFIWGGDPITISPPEMFRGGMTVIGVGIPKSRVGLVVLAALVFVGLWWLLNRTTVGAMVRAGVDDSEMLAALGINIRLVYSAVFLLGAFLAGASGVAGATFLGLYPGVDAEILLFGLVVVVIGGLGSIWGALIGSMLVGLSISFGTVFIPELLYFLIFGPMLLVLIVRPQGLMGKPL